MSFVQEASRMSTTLDDEAFKGKEPVDRRKIEEFRIKGLQELDKVDLSIFRFRGGLRSAFLGSSEFPWSIWRPSTEKPGVWREVEKATALKDGARPLFMAAVVQPWTNLRFQY